MEHKRVVAFNDVAPPAGAWIETHPASTRCLWISVAPPAGAWIETLWYSLMRQISMSRAPRGRVD